MDKTPTREEVEEAKLVLLTSHYHFLQGDPKGIPLDLSGEDLRYANFDKSNLSRASFKDADFCLAKMEGAKLGRAKITDAKLPARLSGNRPDESRQR